MRLSSKLIKLKEGIMGISDLQPVSQKPKWPPGLGISIWRKGQSCGAEPLTCGIWCWRGSVRTEMNCTSSWHWRTAWWWEGNPQSHIYTWWQESLHDIMFITRSYQILLGKVSEKSSSNQHWNNQRFPLSFLINVLLNFPSGKKQRESVFFLNLTSFLFSSIYSITL